MQFLTKKFFCTVDIASMYIVAMLISVPDTTLLRISIFSLARDRFVDDCNLAFGLPVKYWSNRSSPLFVVIRPITRRMVNRGKILSNNSRLLLRNLSKDILLNLSTFLKSLLLSENSKCIKVTCKIKFKKGVYFVSFLWLCWNELTMTSCFSFCALVRDTCAFREIL